MKDSGEAYPGFDKTLLAHITVILQSLKFDYCQPTLRGALFVDEASNSAIIIDYLICDRKFPFSYTEYTKEQNALMHEFSSLFRFIADDQDEFTSVISTLMQILDDKLSEDVIKRGGNRELSEIDPTLPEAYFEQAFIGCYGREALNRVQREFPMIDINGQTRWIDYYIQRQDYSIAIEKNGETYHHPIITGKKQYNKQLIKQNSLVAYGSKVFRWSIQAMQFSDNFSDEMKKYLGRVEDFIVAQKVSVSRNFALFDHQDSVLNLVQEERNAGKNSFLVVLPTGTGKTEVLIADYAREYKSGRAQKCLVMVPSRQLKADHIQKFKNRIKEYGLPDSITIGEKITSNIVVQTYSWLSRQYYQLTSTCFDYIAVDEAHHAMAPTTRKVIHHFKPSTLLGLTATDKRLDNEKLEEVFGSYETDLSLVEAILQGLLAPIKAFRLRSNIDLSEIRFNGKDYVATDLQKSVVVPSRDQLIVDMLLKYFIDTALNRKQGIIFCVSVKHAQSMAKLMKEHKISAMAVSGKENKSSSYIEDYQQGKIQFLTTCSLLNEGWDSPQTSVIVMARPTMSQVLYTQQLGRGTRRHPGKEALYVIDVVDNYGGSAGFNNAPWSAHALLGMPNYMAWANILGPGNGNSHEEEILAGLYEQERLLEKINIFTFETEYPDHISDEQLARSLFVSTGTIKSWVKKGKITPAVTIPVGRQKLNYYTPYQVTEIIDKLKLKKHDETTQYDDFFEFVKLSDFTMSYKIIMMLSMLKVVDHNGECNLDDLLNEYSHFYSSRLKLGLEVDRENCPYKSKDILGNTSKMKSSILQNPFEKFERKRFMYHCKDLNHIAFSTNLWNKINNSADLEDIRRHYFTELLTYYKELGGVPNTENLRIRWSIKEELVSNIVEFPIEDEKFTTCVPFIDVVAAAGDFGPEQFFINESNHDLWIKTEGRLSDDMFALKVVGKSMEPKIPDGSICLFRKGSALAGSRSGRDMLVMHNDVIDHEINSRLTVKRYESDKVYDEYGYFVHSKITLSPLNHDFDPIVITVAEEDEFVVIGEFVRVLE